MSENINPKYIARPLLLPGLLLEPGDEVLIVDSRGRAIKGVFLGYASKFLALSNDCSDTPTRFINIQRINEIMVLWRGKCVEGNRSEETRSTQTTRNDN